MFSVFKKNQEPKTFRERLEEVKAHKEDANKDLNNSLEEIKNVDSEITRFRDALLTAQVELANVSEEALEHNAECHNKIKELEKILA